MNKDKAPTVVGAISEDLGFGEVVPHVLATPRVKALARELGANLASVKGSGPSGVITEEDVRKAATPGKASSTLSVSSELTPEKFGPVERKPFVGTRKSIAARLLKTTTSAPLVTHFDIADVTALAEFRKKEKVTYLPFLIRAVVRALQENPMLNAMLDEAKNEIVYVKYYNVGIAVDTERGLLVPVIKDADKKNIHELATELQGIAERARNRKIALEEMRGGSFTISNVGAVGGMFATPIMNYPQSAILAVGRIADAPVIHDGRVTAGKTWPLSVTFDHRLVDGADAARFCNVVIEALKNPEHL